LAGWECSGNSAAGNKPAKNFQPSAKLWWAVFLWLIRGRHAQSREGQSFRARVWGRREFPTAMAAFCIGILLLIAGFSMKEQKYQCENCGKTFQSVFHG
jgi:hypothetical protein